jgi:two-component system, NtrC family, response regulator HydG
MRAAELNPPVRVLIVEGDVGVSERMCAALHPGFTCETVKSGEEGLTAFSDVPFDVVISSKDLDGKMSGLELLDNIHSQSPLTRFILLGDDGDIGSVIEAGKRGATDYLVKPFDDLTLSGSVSRAVEELGFERLGDRFGDRLLLGDRLRHFHIENAKSASTSTATGTATGTAPSTTPTPTPPSPTTIITPSLYESTIIGSDPELIEALDSVDRVAHATAPVLIIGETGTGKDLIAARIHARGPRRHRPYVVVNAAAIPAPLLDSELFGHVVGAFTGATRARRGLVAEAIGGTLFLDEIADLPLELQGRFLRVLETGAIRPVGADHERRVDVRFLAATQRDLLHAVRAGKFREDLYFRINVLSIAIPPLRDRPGDIPSLIDFFFTSAKTRSPRSPVREISRGARTRLEAWPWPGNVRELQAVVERIVVLGKRAVVEEHDLDATLNSLTPSFLPPPASVTTTTTSSVLSPTSSPASSSLASLASSSSPSSLPSASIENFSSPDDPSTPASLRDMTARYVELVLASTKGDKVRAAAILGIDVSTLYRWRRRRRRPSK